jgi:hypothetical protein
MFPTTHPAFKLARKATTLELQMQFDDQLVKVMIKIGAKHTYKALHEETLKQGKLPLAYRLVITPFHQDTFWFKVEKGTRFDMYLMTANL